MIKLSCCDCTLIVVCKTRAQLVVQSKHSGMLLLSLIAHCANVSASSDYLHSCEAVIQMAADKSSRSQSRKETGQCRMSLMASFYSAEYRKLNGDRFRWTSEVRKCLHNAQTAIEIWRQRQNDNDRAVLFFNYWLFIKYDCQIVDEAMKDCIEERGS